MIPLLLTLPFFLNHSSPVFHVPHDNAHGVASALLPTGQIETVIATQRECRVLRTRDDGLSWEPVAGDGLELGRPDVVVWDPSLSTPRFLIGTDIGVWSYSPISGVVQRFDQGLPSHQGANWACQFAAPVSGKNVPIFMANKLGQVWELNRATETWELRLDSGVVDERAQIAVVPEFNGLGAPGPGKAVAASFQGVLYLSDDAGQNWTVHPQFDQQALNWNDPLITAMAFSHDFAASGEMVLATSIPNENNFSGDEGLIWRSSDYAFNFSAVHATNTSIRAIEPTPAGPSGKQWFMASGMSHPHFYTPELSIGILRSSDGGATWSDYGSAQDFAMEADSAETVKHGRALIHDFAVAPNFAQSGRLVFGRSEGLYYTNDEGLNWRRRSFRPTAQVRGLDSYIDAGGDLIAVAGSYGSGTYNQNMLGDVTLMPTGSSAYVDEIDCSPRMAEDGFMLVGGARGLSFWFDPALQADNPFGTYGWKNVPLDRNLGYVRAFAYSPRFDGRGGHGRDQVFFFSTSSERTTNYYTRNGGRSFEVLDQLANGNDAPYMRHIKVAPTFREQDLRGSADVYAARSRWLFKLEDGKWKLIHSFPSWVTGLAIPEDFDRKQSTPGLPRIFVATERAPYFYEYIDEEDGAIINSYETGLGDGTVIGIATPDNFAQSKTVYLGTFTSGLRKLDLRQPSPQWQTVGDDFPNLWLTTFTLAADFANNPTIIAGSQAGLVVGQDAPGSTWRVSRPPLVRDNEAAEFNFFSPNHPENESPNRPWRWQRENIQATAANTDLEFIDVSIDCAENDGAWLTCSEYAGGISLHTMSGPDCGKVRIEVENYWTGASLKDVTVRLGSPEWSNQELQLDFPFQPVTIRVTAFLEAGEKLYFDGMTFGN